MATMTTSLGIFKPAAISIVLPPHGHYDLPALVVGTEPLTVLVCRLH